MRLPTPSPSCLLIPIACAASFLGINTASRADSPTASLSSPSWQAGQTGHIHIHGASGKISLTVSSDNGKVWSQEITPVAGGTVDVPLPVNQTGFYTLEISGGSSLNFAVVPEPVKGSRSISLSDPQHRMLCGVCTHFSFPTRDQSDANFVLLKNLGIDLVRDEMAWGAVETKKGEYEFPARFGYVDKLRRNNIQLLVVAGYNNRLYGPGRKPPVGEGTLAYGRYCAEILKRYGSNICALEVYNEPNDFNPVTDYLPLLRDTYQQVRAAKLFEAGGAAYCDAFSQHPYTSPSAPDLGYSIKDGAERNANLDLALKRAASLLDHYQKPRGGWITEQGWPSPAVIGERKQAAFVSRALLTASAYPHLEGYVLYDFQDDGADPKNKEHHFGLVRQDLTPKPSYQAYAVAVNFLKDKTFIRPIVDRDSRLMGNIYHDGRGRYWLACWATELTLNEVGKGEEPGSHHIRETMMTADETLPFTLSSGTPSGGYDWQGRPLAAGVKLTASILPMYIDLGPNADAMVHALP